MGEYEEFDNYTEFIVFLDDPGSRHREFNFAQHIAPTAIASTYVKSSNDLEKIKE